MSNVLDAINKLKLKNSKNHFSNLVLYLTAYRHMKIQAYETTFETTCKISWAVTSRLLTRGLSFYKTSSNFTRRHVFKFQWSNKKLFFTEYWIVQWYHACRRRLPLNALREFVGISWASCGCRQSRQWVDGSWVSGSNGSLLGTGHMGHGSVRVDPW